MPAAQAKRFARRDGVDVQENRASSGGELKLQQFGGGFSAYLWRDQIGLQQRLQLGGEDHAASIFCVVKRFDAKRIPREIERMVARIVKGDRIHAAQGLGEIGAVAGIGRKRHFAIGVRLELAGGEVAVQLEVIVNVAIGD